MRLFGRFPAHPGLTNCQGSLSQLHFKAANCFICHDLDLRHRSRPVETHIPYTFICITQHGAITVTLNGNLYKTKLNESITTLLLCGITSDTNFTQTGNFEGEYMKTIFINSTKA